jgi:hypothetical protein
MSIRVPPPDRPIVIWELLERIAVLKSAGVDDPAEVERLAEEYRRLRAEL